MLIQREPTHLHHVPPRYVVRPGSNHLGELLIRNLSSYRMSSSQKSNVLAFLKSSDATELCNYLREAIKTASETQLEALASLLAPLSAQADVKRHCVRCHVTYTQNENHSTACEIKHNEGGETEIELRNDEGVTTLNCCGTSFSSEDVPDREICFSAPHTTNVEDVLYCESGNEDDDGVNTNVVRCGIEGCPKKRKAMKQGGNKGGSASKKQKSI